MKLDIMKWLKNLFAKQKGPTTPYCIPEKRELTLEERHLLGFLVEQTDTVTARVDRVKVVARCGCGECPTILFGESLDDEPITSKDSKIVADWYGRAANGTLVGVTLFALNGKPTELEAWSIDGGEVETSPPIDALEPLASLA